MCLKCDCMRICPPRFSQQWRERYSAPPDERTKKRRCANATFDFGGLAAFSPVVPQNQPLQMPFVQNNYMVQQLSSATSHPTLRSPFCRGLRKVVRTSWLPIALANATTRLPNL